MEILTKDANESVIYVLKNNSGWHEFHKSGNVNALDSSSKKTLDAKSTLKFLKLIYLLRPAEQMRCHMPGFAFEILYEGAGNLRGSICFQCNNIIVTTPQLKGTIKFDPAAPPGRNLLRFLNRQTGQELEAIDC